MIGTNKNCFTSYEPVDMNEIKVQPTLALFSLKNLEKNQPYKKMKKYLHAQACKNTSFIQTCYKIISYRTCFYL